MGDSLNNMVLNSQMLAGLFARALVQPGPASGSTSGTTAENPVPDHRATLRPETVITDHSDEVPQVAAAGRSDEQQPDAVAADHSGERAEAGPTPVKFLGSNQKNVLLLVRQENTAFLPEEQLVLLTKMLKACGMNLGDVAIANLAGGQQLDEILQGLQPRKLISFGALEPATTPPFPVVSRDGADWLMAPGLENLLQETGRNPPLKMGLWNAMKQLFNIN